MIITVTTCCGIEGEIVEAGEVVDVPEVIGKRLLGMGKAVEGQTTAATPVDLNEEDD